MPESLCVKLHLKLFFHPLSLSFNSGGDRLAAFLKFVRSGRRAADAHFVHDPLLARRHYPRVLEPLPAHARERTNELRSGLDALRPLQGEEGGSESRQRGGK